MQHCMRLFMLKPMRTLAALSALADDGAVDDTWARIATIGSPRMLGFKVNDLEEFARLEPDSISSLADTCWKRFQLPRNRRPAII